MQAVILKKRNLMNLLKFLTMYQIVSTFSFKMFYFQMMTPNYGEKNISWDLSTFGKNSVYSIKRINLYNNIIINVKYIFISNRSQMNKTIFKLLIDFFSYWRCINSEQ